MHNQSIVLLLNGRNHSFKDSKCQHCHTFCLTLYSKRMHLKTCNGAPRYSVKDGDQVTGSTLALNKKCRLCKAKYFLHSTLLDHYKNKHKKNKQFRSYKRNIRRNFASHQCELCSKKFFQQCQLFQHMTYRHPQSPQTEVLSKIFTRNLDIGHNCASCDFKFQSSLNLLHHMNYAHSEFAISQDKFQCKGCSKIFMTPTKLLQHIEDKPITTNHNIKMYREHIFNMKNINQCDICDFQFLYHARCQSSVQYTFFTLFYTRENYINHIKKAHQNENIAIHIARAYKHVTGY